MNYRITTLTAQKRDPQRINVYLDGEFAFGIARILAAWLRVGQEISDDKISQLLEEDARETAYLQAIKFIQYRPRTEAEVRQNLIKHTVPTPVVDHVIDRLKRNGLLDDARFAQAWIENRNERRPRSRRALYFELHQRGIDAAIIEQSLQAVDEQELAYQAALKKARNIKNLEWKDFRQKMYAYLIQRGFNYEVTSQAVARIWDEIKTETHTRVDEEGLL